MCIGYHLRPDPPPHSSRNAAIVLLRLAGFGEGADSNRVDARAAARFYCEYKTRERIHGSLADLPLLVIPASRGRLQTSIRTEVGFRD